MNSLRLTHFLSKPISDHPNLFKGMYVLGWAIFVFYYAVNIANPHVPWWDVVGYVASAYELSGLSGEALRAATYEDIRNAVSPDTFSALTNENDIYRLTVYEDASALQQNLPFYKIRYVYVWMTYAIGQWTGSFSQATVLISAVSGIFILLISGLLFWNAGVIAFLLVPPAVVLLGDLPTLASLAQPDAIAALASIFLCVLILARKHKAAVLLIALLPLFRTDFVIFALAAGFVLFLRGNSRLAVLSASLALLTYFAVNHFAGNHGYAVIFNFTLIDRSSSPYILQMPISDNVRDYVEAYIRGVRRLIDTPEIYLYPLITATVFFFTSARERYRNRFFSIYLACLFFVAVHFLLFPAAFLRHYFILPWASIMYLAEAFALYRHPEQKDS